MHDRYESRVIWLVPLAVFAVLAARHQSATSVRAVRWLYEKGIAAAAPRPGFERQPVADAAGAPTA